MLSFVFFLRIFFQHTPPGIVCKAFYRPGFRFLSRRSAARAARKMGRKPGCPCHGGKMAATLAYNLLFISLLRGPQDTRCKWRKPCAAFRAEKSLSSARWTVSPLKRRGGRPKPAAGKSSSWPISSSSE